MVSKKTTVKKKATKKSNPPLHPLKRSLKSWNEDKVIDLICDELATSSQGLGKIIINQRDMTGDFPSYSTIMKWISEDDKISDKYARAKEAQADYMADEMLDIADDGSNDWMAKLDKDGSNIGYQLNGEHVQRSRLRLDTRKWLASKLKPKKYGEKIQQEHSGQVGLTQVLEDLDGLNAGLPKRSSENEE